MIFFLLIEKPWLSSSQSLCVNFITWCISEKSLFVTCWSSISRIYLPYSSSFVTNCDRIHLVLFSWGRCYHHYRHQKEALVCADITEFRWKMNLYQLEGKKVNSFHSSFNCYLPLNRWFILNNYTSTKYRETVQQRIGLHIFFSECQSFHLFNWLLFSGFLLSCQSAWLALSRIISASIMCDPQAVAWKILALNEQYSTCDVAVVGRHEHTHTWRGSCWN